MTARAGFRGRPALTSFPFALLYGAFASDLAGRLLEREALWAVGHYLGLAGVVTGVGAVVYGAKWRTRKRTLVSLCALALFALAGWVGGAAEVAPDPVLVGMEGIGAALLTAVGWTGRARRGWGPGGPDPAGLPAPNFGKEGAP
jgi:hypothetical protein